MKKKKIDKLHVAGVDVRLIWTEKMLREHMATAMYVPQDHIILLHEIYKGDNLETMKCFTHELIHVLERYMNFSLDDGVLDSIAQGIIVAFVESGLLNPDDFIFGED